MRLLLLGPPGSGKGTQADVAAKELKVPHISTGELFRAEIAAETELGKLAASYMDGGNLVPDEVVNAMARERLSRPDAEGFLLDGYPRTVQQAEALEVMLHELQRPLHVAVTIDVPSELIVDRAVGRLVCPNCGAVYHIASKPPKLMGLCDVCRTLLVTRADDQPSTVRHRLGVYNRLTKPVLHFYEKRSLLRVVDGAGSRDEVSARLRHTLRDVDET